ncbi:MULTISPECIES: UDP-N-acetylmuramate dehydrogenase [Clostridium]|jgi:UDP-N-acetylmuramate dehydrogenase (EC 1.1.1.158)|uniref:UDP-N-acetylenolpyruvoylglucosamine reductase n=4 Tax=Clostridium TaxID=1485 RepID=MURB_CLOB8|nr:MULTISPECIES: UDP-N-acetylmuramate dehydrogenase [Clostridium]A6M2Y4.1 RecName: Full=UDP-N-acetylenolpyruvoylglucosamine reductase; AltName: Full=UDP-N-acetylmuramate dehydrogenase [Clostridium beijerinckii NCIMB 8052]ABR36964.1 UDP-N-acetylenolpyruvoylglucosamine reductase [Clostridium beijerinckii NCIMB 8052]AIU00325.1 UDP-N-acetylenolpyruvoylglucosamine reductase [Clostridium beijerinckii ATCC 35702]AJH01977.1 UDP-N-acetylenolpyruvoylglucosamine reductase [Clostridium beijerinckii]ALB440
MKHYGEYKNLFSKLYEESQIQLDAKMSEHIYFKVGGPVDILLTPNSIQQVKETITICKENNIPFYVIGNGSNILVKDGGIRGVVIKLCELNKIECIGNKIIAECGALLKDVSKAATEGSLAGFQFACGIPGSVGGAVFMNAGAYDGEISFVIESAEVLDDNQEIRIIPKSELNLGYRQSVVMQKGYIVLRATFNLVNGDKEKIQARVDELTKRREERQPLEYPSAGSTFKRPEGYFAGKLIEDAGLKGFAIGGACVSEKHAGFVINCKNGTAKDVLDVIYHVRDEVKKQFGVDLYPEVRIWGED